MLIKLALVKDQATQEHAVEAIAELVTIPAIQVENLPICFDFVVQKYCIFPCKLHLILMQYINFVKQYISYCVEFSCRC